MDSKVCNRCATKVDIAGFPVIRGKPASICKSCRNQYAKAWRASNTSWDQKAYHAEWRKENRAKLNATNKAWRDGNPELMQSLRQAWAKRNPERVKAIHERHWKKKLTRPDFKVHNRIKSRLSNCLKAGKGGGRTFELLGYSVAELMAHLERQFVKGMGWHNMGEWHIDHIVPLAAFDIAEWDDPSVKRAWSLPNLRPLWARENLRKHQKRTHLL